MLKALLKCNLQFFAKNIQIIAILPNKYLENLLILLNSIIQIMLGRYSSRFCSFTFSHSKNSCCTLELPSLPNLKKKRKKREKFNQ
jgi:hypothetical protein